MREALLGPRFHGVMFDHRIMDFLLDHFLNHDFNVAFFRRGLQVRDSPTLATSFSGHLPAPSDLLFFR